jgi:hypothetical protein
MRDACGRQDLLRLSGESGAGVDPQWGEGFAVWSVHGKLDTVRSLTAIRELAAGFI